MKVIVISAHPDDEALGAGGTLLRHIENGDDVTWLIATDVTVNGGFTEERVKSRHEEVKKVAELFGFKEVIQLNFATMTLSSSELPNLVGEFAEVFNRVKPEVIYCPNRSDAHSDHRVVFDAAWACTKSFRYPFVRKFLMYECISETEFAPPLQNKSFSPNYYVDISDYHKKKLDIMKVYASELGEHPFPRSFRNMTALATFRGAVAGVDLAEAFQLLKYID